MIKVKFIDNNAVISGEFNFGYMGIYRDEQISICDNPNEIRYWDIVGEHFDGNFTDEQLADFLTEYFNNFEKRIKANIKQVNDNFLVDVYLWFYETRPAFWKEPSITNAEYLPENLENFNPYVFQTETDKILQEYNDASCDDNIERTDIEDFLRRNFPMLNIDNLINGIIPENLYFDDANISFECSDSIENREYKILSGASNTMDEEMKFFDFQNFNL